MASQNENAELKDIFKNIAAKLAQNEEIIIEELNNAQGEKIDLGGYYEPNDALASKAMRPSTTFNAIISSI